MKVDLEDVNFEELARCTEDFNGAQMKAVAVESGMIALRRLVVLYCTVLYCTVLYCTVLYCTALHCTVLYCTVLFCTQYC